MDTENKGATNATPSDGILQKLKELGFDSLDKLLEEREQLKTERDNFKEQHENLEKLMKRQGNELGELRKKVETMNQQDKKVEPDKQEAPPKQKEESVEEIEASLNDEQRKKADEVFAQLSDEEKVLVAGNPKYRKQIFDKVRQVVKAVPKSLFEKINASSDESDKIEQRIVSLFDTEHKRSRFIPNSPARSGDVGGKPPEARKIPHIGGGILEAAKSMRG